MDNKAALRQLLRWKRGQLDPVELGLRPATGRGRRAPGLSQAQVARLLFVSERTYAQLERGDMPSPAADFLDRVCGVLRLAEGERTAVYVYALGHEPPRPRDPLGGQSIHPAWQEAVRGVTGQPCYVRSPWPPEREAATGRCCARHVPSWAGDVTMCVAMPLGAPGARFFMLVFKPHRTSPV